MRDGRREKSFKHRVASVQNVRLFLPMHGANADLTCSSTSTPKASSRVRISSAPIHSQLSGLLALRKQIGDVITQRSLLLTLGQLDNANNIINVIHRTTGNLFGRRCIQRSTVKMAIHIAH